MATQTLPAVDVVDWHHAFPAASVSDLDDARVAWSEVIPGGHHWSWRLRRGCALRLVALDEGPTNLSMVLYAAHDTQERYNMPDSVKAQHTAHYTQGHVLMSDMGRAMASIVHDTVGWHDPFGLLLDTPRMQHRYGTCTYGMARNGMHRSGKEGLLIEIGKYGLSARDLAVGVNWFSKVSVTETGAFVYHAHHTQPGDTVDLRLDMDVIVAVSAAPHPLDPSPVYQPGRVGVIAHRVGPAGPDDVCRHFRPENARALHNTEQFYA